MKKEFACATSLALSLFVVSWAVQPLAGQSGGASAAVWLTTADQAQLLAPQPPVPFGGEGSGNSLTIDVDESARYQQMDGFGASFTDSSAWLVYNSLSAHVRAQLMVALFDATNGIGLSYLRQPMGATEFALSNYTYDDVPTGVTDPTLAEFSIAHDQAYILPVVRQALQVNPAVRVIATPWSPPAWMKSNHSLFGGSLNTDAMTLTALANYFVKFIEQYGAAGVPIDRITPQNEPLNVSSSYPTMSMDAATESTFIAGYLARAFASAGLRTAIVAYDHNWDDASYPESVLGGSASAFVAGSAWHCYAGAPTAMTVVHDAYPSKDIFFTECTAGEWSPSFAANLRWDMENIVIGAARNWARTITKWNMALDTNHGPQNGGCTNCDGLVTIDRRAGAYRFNFDYYTLGHVSKFVRPGACRIASNTFGSGSIEDVAFENPDGSKALVVLNSGGRPSTFSVRQGDARFSYTLPAGAVATFTWKTAQPAPSPAPAPSPNPTAGGRHGSRHRSGATVGRARRRTSSH